MKFKDTLPENSEVIEEAQDMMKRAQELLKRGKLERIVIGDNKKLTLMFKKETGKTDFPAVVVKVVGVHE